MQMGYSAKKLFPVYQRALGVDTTPLGSQLLEEIGTKFQRLPYVFGVQQLNRSSVNAVRHKPEVRIKDGGRHTGSTYISGSR